MTPPERERVKAHAFVDDLAQPALDDADRHHLLRVLRVRPADLVTVSDGAGGVRSCRLGRAGDLEPLTEIERVEPPRPPITVGFAVVKGERPEWVVQKLTELGVDRIVPFASERSVVRWEGDRALKHTERLRIVSREAAMQSRRLFLPTVEAPASFVALAGVEGVFRADGNGDHPMSNMTTILVGPEGGWTDTEREIVPHSVRLSDAVLRSETAAVAAGALFTAFRSGLTQPARGQ